jgi:hypothetical protein
MNDLIYFFLPAIKAYDYSVTDKGYKFHQWFNSTLARTFTSRVHKLDTPWPMASTLCPLPAIVNNYQTFGDSIESIADRFCKETMQSGRVPYLAWSGGIDSTTILVSLLKVASQDFLKKLVVLHNATSIIENPYFYNRYIDQKLQTQEISTFEITPHNYNNIIVLDGQCGNQCLTGMSISINAYYSNFDLFDRDWKTIDNFSTQVPQVPILSEFSIELIKESINYSPVPINTVYDFLWWAAFNFRFDHGLLDKVLIYTKHLDRLQTQTFYNQGLYRFYAQPEMQSWSMSTVNERRVKTRTHSPKWHAKNYIYEFDHNDLWYSTKKEEPSITSKLNTDKVQTTIVAIDTQWNKYDIRDSTTRRMLGQILQKD